MVRNLTLLFVFAGLWVTGAYAETPLAKGKMLVATEMIQGDVFSKTVIILLHYDSTGAMGLVVNRPTEVAIEEVLPEGDALVKRADILYWGGPVQMNSLRVMIRTQDPPGEAENVVGSVYLVSLNDDSPDELDKASHLRIFLGYAGWAPGQLDRELATGSWIVVDASEERVFPAEPAKLWDSLAPAVEYRAAID